MKLKEEYIIKEKKEKNIITNEKNNSFNLLIEGENYKSLLFLKKEYKWLVDVIIIDPPYNTWNTKFKYFDKRFDKNNKWNHSSWLLFIQERLELAKKLLTKDWVIFINIDDNELAHLKILCDTIFWESNFIEIFSWKKTMTPSNLSQKTKKTIEYILCYSVNKKNVKFKWLKKESKSSCWLLNQTNKENILVFPANIVTTWLKDWIYKKGRYWTSNYDIKLLEDTEVKNWLFSTNVILKSKFKWTQKKLNNEITKWTKIEIRANTFSPSYDKLDYWFDKPSNFIDKSVWVWTNENWTKELSEIIWKNNFNYPKPISLVKYILSFFTKKDLVVLDFFAWSGTTWNAILKLNKEDWWNRKFILCTNNENNICQEITYKRLYNIMNWYEFIGKQKQIIFEKKIKINDVLKKDWQIWLVIKDIIEKNKLFFDKFEKKLDWNVLKIFWIKKVNWTKEWLWWNLKYYSIF